METPSQNAPTVAATGLRYGVLLGIINIAFSFLIITTGLVGNTVVGFVPLLLSIAGIVLALRDFRTRNGGFMSYGEGLGIGALLSLISGLLGATFNVVYRFIDPGMTQQMTEQMRAKFAEGGRMTEAQIDQAIAMTQKFSTGPLGFVITVVGSVLIGTFLSLIIAAILKNPKPEFD